MRVFRVKFAAECLGFSNVSVDSSASAPDNGSSYDFADVRDHYLEELFGLDAITSPDRSRALHALTRHERRSRTAHLLEWRAPASGCGRRAGLFYRDLAPGAGWGLTDSDGIPKGRGGTSRA